MTTELTTCCAYTIAVQDNPIFEGKYLHCDTCGQGLKYSSDEGWKHEPFEGLCNSANCTSEHEHHDAPTAPERGEWRVVGKTAIHDATGYEVAAVRLDDNAEARAAQIVTEHNQHSTLIAQRERLIDGIRDVAIRSLLYCEQKYDHDDQARLNLEALLKSVLTTIEQERGREGQR